MQARYIHEGKALDYTPEIDIAAGTVVVVNGHACVTKMDIQAGRLGTLHVVGVYDVEKAAGAIPLGSEVYWDDVTKKAVVTKTETTAKLGIAVRAANAEDTLVRVLLG